MVFNKTTIMSLFYLARFANITLKKELQTSKISSKAIKHPFNKSLLAFTGFWRWTLIHIKNNLHASFATSALTFRNFVPRLELLTLFRDFRKCMKMCEINYFSFFANHIWFYFYHLSLALRFYPHICGFFGTVLGFLELHLWEPCSQLASADRQSSRHERTASHHCTTPGQWTWFVCTVGVITANNLSMQELYQFNRNWAPDFRFARKVWFLAPFSKRGGEWPFFLSCGCPCPFDGN